MCSVTPPVTDIATVGPKSWSRFLGVSRDICTGCGVRARGVGAAIDRACVGVWVRNLRDPLGCSRGSGTVLVLSVLLVLVSISTETNTQGGLGLQHPTPHRETFSGGQPHAIQNIEVVLSVDYVTSSYLLRHTIIFILCHIIIHWVVLSLDQAYAALWCYNGRLMCAYWVRARAFVVCVLCAYIKLGGFFLLFITAKLFVGSVRGRLRCSEIWSVFFLACFIVVYYCKAVRGRLRCSEIWTYVCIHMHVCVSIYMHI
jgi:hypothetical protein